MKEFEKRVRNMGLKLSLQICIIWIIVYYVFENMGLFKEIKKGVDLGTGKGIVFAVYIAVFAGTAIWALWIMFTAVIYQKWNKSFRILKDYGDIKDIVNAINSDYEKLNVGKNIRKPSTENWFLLDGYYKVLAIPKFMVVAVDAMETIKGKKRYISLYIDLINGKRKIISLNRKTGEQATDDIINYIDYPDIEKQENIKEFIEISEEAEKIWKEYKKYNKSPYFEFINGTIDKEIIDIRDKFLAIGKNKSM